MGQEIASVKYEDSFGEFQLEIKYFFKKDIYCFV
jgi:hypothetical protein